LIRSIAVASLEQGLLFGHFFSQPLPFHGCFLELNMDRSAS
jgi:hypothetical protein